MDRDRARILGLFAIHLALLVVSLFVLSWFVATTPAGTMSIDLRRARMCISDGDCMAFSLGQIKSGMYGSLAFTALYGAIVFSLLVGFQAVARLTSGVANVRLSKLGYLGGIGLFGNAFVAAYLFNPQVTGIQSELMGIDVERTIAPILYFLAMFVGIAVLYFASSQTTDDVGEYKPLAPLPAQKHPSSPPASAIPQKTSSSPPSSAFGSGPISVIPVHLQKKMKYVALTAQITRAGIDARREDGSSQLVLWRDVVGLVARRMPAELDGITFLDIVSSPGSTVRITPWTRVTGETFAGEGDAFTRAVLGKLVGYCASATLDPATQRFHKGELAAQLPDGEKLAAHDAKLA